MIRVLLLAALLALPATAWAPPPWPLLLSDVVAAADGRGVPRVAAYTLWLRECSGRTVCVAGDGGTSFGPYQIKAVAAERHCAGIARWWEGAGNAECAMRILRYGLDRCGLLRSAFTHYQHPERLRLWGCKWHIRYAWETYELMLRLTLEATRPS